METYVHEEVLGAGQTSIADGSLAYVTILMVTRAENVYREINVATLFTTGLAEWKYAIGGRPTGRIRFDIPGNPGGEKVSVIYKR